MVNESLLRSARLSCSARKTIKSVVISDIWAAKNKWTGTDQIARMRRDKTHFLIKLLYYEIQSH